MKLRTPASRASKTAGSSSFLIASTIIGFNFSQLGFEPSAETLSRSWIFYAAYRFFSSSLCLCLSLSACFFSSSCLCLSLSAFFFSSSSCLCLSLSAWFFSYSCLCLTLSASLWIASCSCCLYGTLISSISFWSAAISILVFSSSYRLFSSLFLCSSCNCLFISSSCNCLFLSSSCKFLS